MSPLPFLLLSSSFSLPQNIDSFHIFFGNESKQTLSFWKMEIKYFIPGMAWNVLIFY